MQTLPDPPNVDALRRIGAGGHLHTLPAGTELWRIYFRGGAHPTTWRAFRVYGPLLTARFDHHLAPPHEQERAILYAATEATICVAEVFQATRVIDPHRGAPWLVGFRTTASIALLDLTGLWPTYAGGSQEINSGDRATTRRWSQAIYAAFPDVGGLWYRSKMHGGMPSIALYERVAAALADAPSFHNALASPEVFDVLKEAAATLRYILM